MDRSLDGQIPRVDWQFKHPRSNCFATTRSVTRELPVAVHCSFRGRNLFRILEGSGSFELSLILMFRGLHVDIEDMTL